MEKSEEDVFTCPSFNSYSSNKLSETAVRVAAEKNNDNNNINDDEDFEFSLVRDDNEFFAEEIGQLRPIFPVFNRDLLLKNDDEDKRLESRINVPLSKLFLEENDDHQGGDNNNPPSCSSSEADELENIPEGTYCVWRPRPAAEPPSPSWCKKSKSTGSASKRWNFRDLLRRSNSEGKDSFVFLTPKNRGEKLQMSPKNRDEKLRSEVSKKGKGKNGGGSGGGAPPPRSAHEALYVRNRTIKEGDKKKSYLPYRQDLVGFFVNVNVLSRTLPRF